MRDSEKKISLFMTLMKGALLGVALSLLLILLMSVALEKAWLELKNTQNVTLVIKLLSSLASAALCIKLYKNKALLTGALAGASYAVLAYLSFSIISGRFMFSWGIAGDIGIGVLCGGFVALLMKTIRL